MSPATPDPRARLRRSYEACPLCDSAQFGKLREDDCRGHAGYDPGLPPTMIWCLCRDCGHCFVDGYLTDEGLDLLFKKTQGARARRPRSGRPTRHGWPATSRWSSSA